MNLVKLITDQFSGDTMDKLSGMLGADRSTVSTAISAAIPSMLAGVFGMASDDDGARKLSTTLSSVDTNTAGDFMRSLGGDTGSMVQKGSNLLGSLFGGNTRSGLVDSISRFSGLGSSATGSLLSFLAPMILGKLATVWKSMGGGTSALTSLFADQKQNIANAIPSGFSLGSIPGLGSISSALGAVGSAASAAGSSVAGASRRAAANVERTSRSGFGWLAAVAAALVIGVIVWNVRRPEEPLRSPTSIMPNVDQVTTTFRGALNSLGDSFAGIKDAASANAAVPKLRELNAELDELQSSFNALPESGRNALRNTVRPQLNTLTNRASELLKIPGLSTECRNQFELIMRKLSDWGMTAPLTAPIPAP